MTGIPELPPFLFLILAAVSILVLPRKAGSLVSVATPLGALLLLLQYDHGILLTWSFAGFDLILLELGRINLVFGIIFLLITSVASLYAWHVEDKSQQMAALLYGAGALGVTFAGDFLTLLMFWELMAVASSWLVFARRTDDSRQAGFRYLLVHLVGGSLLFGGIILYYAQTGSLRMVPLNMDMGLPSWLILLGVGLNVAIPPLHPWLPDAYPRATVTGAIFMSALTTKSAVYVLLVLFAGWEILIYMGLFMAFYGVFYAVLANDIRRVLAYHIISQVGYMVTGVGIGTELAMNGTVAHAYSHILYKALLFMGAGAVLQATGVSRLNELGGLAPKMRAVLWLFMVGAFSISGFPLFNGFISKSMIVSAAGHAHLEGIMLGLLLVSIGTFLSIALKIPVFAFWGKDRQLEVKPLPGNMYLAMGIAASLCLFYGIFPNALYVILPYEVNYQPYTAYHLIEAIQMLTFSFIGFWLLRGKLAGEPYLALDMDWFYRRGGPVANRLLVRPVNRFFEEGAKGRGWMVETVSRLSRNPHSWIMLKSDRRDRFDPDTERFGLWAGASWVTFFVVSICILFYFL